MSTLNGGPGIVTNGLVLYLDAANPASYVSGSTTWNDLTRDNNNGTLTNGPTFNSSNLGSIVFDGVDDYIQMSGTLQLTQATFLVWLYKAASVNNYSGIMQSRYGGGGVTGINFNSTGTQLGYHWNDIAASYQWNSGLVIPDLNWCMGVIAVAPTITTGYLYTSNGLSIATNSLSVSSTLLENINIARDPFGSGRYVNGNIAVASIYNRALSAAEIQQNFNATKSRFNLT